MPIPSLWWAQDDPCTFQKATAGKWKWDWRHCEIRTLLKCRLRSLWIPAQVSCIIFYRDCISTSICMTLPVLNRTKAHCCCQPHFICPFADAGFFIGRPEEHPSVDLLFPDTLLFGLHDFWEDKLRSGCFSYPWQRKRELLCRESWFMCKLPVALYLLCPWRVHTQMKGSVGQGWVCAGFSRCRNDRVGDVVKDYQTGSDVLLLFTHGVAQKNKIRHTRGFCSVSAKHHHSCTVSLSSAFCIRSFAHLSRHGNALL